MLYSNVTIKAFGYELAPHVITTEDLEERLAPVYEKLHIRRGQIETITGISERRYWDKGYPMHAGATQAGKKALENAAIDPARIGMLIYAGVCRDNLEPATACAVANGLDLGSHTLVFDISNACLGVLNGMVQIANAIELGQIEAGLVVSCESARQIVELSIQRLIETPTMEVFKKTIATMTGGSGAIGVVLTRSDGSSGAGHRFLGYVAKSATEYHHLCRWGPDTGIPASAPQIMETDSVGVLQNGVTLGMETFQAFREQFDWPADAPDKIICHQVGEAHQRTVLEAIDIPAEKDFSTYPYLGNIGTVSMPITAAIAEERDFLLPGDRVGLFGIGSGLNCLLMGVEW